MADPSQRRRVLEYLYGELPPDEAAAFEQDLEAEPELQALLAEERQFDARFPVGSGATVSGPFLQETRSLVRAALRREASQRSWLERVQDGLREFVPRLAWPAAAAALLLAGVVLGRGGARLGHQPTDAPPGRIVGLRITAFDRQTDQVQLEAVSLSTHALTGAIDDPVVRRALVQALTADTRPATRLNAVDLLRRDAAASPVEDALIHALLHDDNPGVRVAAVEALQPLTARPSVRAGLRQALRADPNHGVRVAAIDALSEHPEPATAELFERTSAIDASEYLRDAAQQALQRWSSLRPGHAL